MVKLIKNSDLAKSQKVSILTGASAYAALKQIVTKEGILKRDYGFYTLLAVFVFGGFFFSIYYVVITPLSWQLAFWSLVFSFFTVQIGGLIHDSGHRAIFSSSRANDILGYICDGFVTIGYGSWNVTHNKHHASPNTEDEDPDIELPLHSFTKERFAKQKGLLKFLSQFQVYLYYPFRSLVPITRRLSSFRYFKAKRKWSMWWEVTLWAMGIFIYFVLPFLVFPLPKAIFLFIFVNLTTGFYMSNIFAPNHKGMPQIAKDVKLSFLEHQILTTRNVNRHPITDFVFLGLNYQIEHHLFPNCPRNKLKLITPHVLAICKKLNLEFTEVSVLESNKIILRELKQIAAKTQ